MFLFTCILEPNRQKLIFKTFSGFACAEACVEFLCLNEFYECDWRVRTSVTEELFLRQTDGDTVLRWYGQVAMWRLSRDVTMTIDTRATQLCSLSSTNRNAKAYFSGIYLLQTTCCSSSIHWSDSMNRAMSLIRWFEDQRDRKGKCTRADFMPEQHITHDKHVLKASELCMNSARSIHNANAHAAHCMMNWNLQVPGELLV